MHPSPASLTSIPNGVVAGISATASMTVCEGDTAQCLGSGDVPVLATPRLVALCEEATCRVLDGRLAQDRTSVASRIQFDHLSPVRIGGKVTAEATLERVEGRRLIFTVSATYACNGRTGLAAAGRVTRVVVDRSAFLAKAGCAGSGTPTPGR